MSVGEVWRLSPREPALLVSSEGRVMMRPFIGDMPYGGSRHYGGTPTFGVWSKPDARFHYTYRGKTYKVAQLVCEAFNGPAPFDGAVVMHTDENAANNRAGNLKWGTQKENLNAPGFLEYCRSRTGENSPTVKARAKG